MGTRSIVAIPTESGWKGRYVHWDGYPEGVGASLVEIVKRDGYETAVHTLTQEHYGWSSVDGEDVQQLGTYQGDGRFVAVPGYGTAYSASEQANEWITSEDTDFWGTEWCYVMEPDGTIRVLEDTGAGWTERDSLYVAPSAPTLEPKAELEPWQLDGHEGLKRGDPTPQHADGVKFDCPWGHDGYLCTRSAGHDGHDHVAAGTSFILRTWAWGEGYHLGTGDAMGKIMASLSRYIA